MSTKKSENSLQIASNSYLGIGGWEWEGVREFSDIYTYLVYSIFYSIHLYYSIYSIYLKCTDIIFLTYKDFTFHYNQQWM